MSQGQLAAGRSCSWDACCLPGLSAHSLHSLLLQIRYLLVVRYTASGPQLARLALSCKLEKALLWVEAASQLHNLVSRRHLSEKKKPLLFLGCSPAISGSKAWSANAREISVQIPSFTWTPLHGVRTEPRDRAWPLISHNFWTFVKMNSCFSQVHSQKFCD